MKLVLEMESSLEFWRRVYPLDRAPSSPTGLPDDKHACSKRDVLTFAPGWMTPEYLAQTDGRIHAFATGREHRRSSCQHVTHTWSSKIPEESFFCLSENVFVASPEFVFLNAARLLDITQLIALGDELCGLYGFDASSSRGFRNRTVPLTCRDKLSRYITRANGCPGSKRARTALRYVIDKSASPMETFDEMTMCLPYKMGGYHVFTPIMNHEVLLDPKASRIARQDRCYADMCWPEFQLDIEHQGAYDHSQPKRALSDRSRINALRIMGFEVIELTGEQVGDLHAYESIVRFVAKRLGKRIRNEYLGALPARIALRHTLFSWNKSSGAIRPPHL